MSTGNVSVNVVWFGTKGQDYHATSAWRNQQQLNTVSPYFHLSPKATSLLVKSYISESSSSIKTNEKSGENVVNLDCGIVDTVGRIKKRVHEDYLKNPPLKHLRLRLMRTGSLIPDETPLCDILARTTAAWTLDFVLESADHSRLPIQIADLETGGDQVTTTEEDTKSATIDSEELPPGVISVKINDDQGNLVKLVKVEIVDQSTRKPFLGGYRQMPSEKEFHHANSQTISERRRKFANIFENMISRPTQCAPRKHKLMQTTSESATQTERLGICISKINDKTLAPSGSYRTSTDVRIIQIRAAIKIQGIYRKYSERKRKRLELLAELEDSSMSSIEAAEAAAENEPKSKEDFQRLYAKLEAWRLSEEKHIATTKSGYSLRRSRAKLVSSEALQLAELAANRDAHKLAEKQDVIKNVILKAGQPRVWFSSKGQMLQLETPSTQRARDLADVYKLLSSDEEAEGPDRLPALAALSEMLGNLEPCPLSQEIISLLRREEELISRGVRASNLTGLRQRICSKYMQLMRSPDHNPEITRYETQLPVPVLHSARPGHRKRGGMEFCLSCRNYLPRTKFSLSSGPAVGRCNNCEQLDNDARSRQDLSVYKSMLDRIKHDEESKDNTTSPIFQLQDSDIRYIVRSFWDSRSILSGLANLYELRLIRWIKEEEWSPWNCILLTHSEADVHMQLTNFYKAYGGLLVQKIRHKHTLARNHFSKLSTMANYFRGGSNDNRINEAGDNGNADTKGNTGEATEPDFESSPVPLSSASISVSASLTN